MTLIARYASICPRCHQDIRVGQQIEWIRDQRACHTQCAAPVQPTGTSVAAEPEPIRLHGGSGYGCRGWQVGTVVRSSDRQIAEGQSEFLVILTAGSRYYREDGLSVGVGDDSGRTYWATARPATEAEAAPLVAQRAARQAERERAQALSAIHSDIMTTGEYPEGTHRPEGEEIPVGDQRTRLYGGGEWFVVGPEWIWAVRNNGADGDAWDANNVHTGGAGAIGRRIPSTPDLVARIRTLVP